MHAHMIFFEENEETKLTFQINRFSAFLFMRYTGLWKLMHQNCNSSTDIRRCSNIMSLMYLIHVYILGCVVLMALFSLLAF